MNIQIISYSKQNVNCEGYNIDCSTFDAPKAFDSYDINIISLQDSDIWKNKDNSIKSLNCIKDFNSLRALITASKKSQIIVLLPVNYTFYYYYSLNSKKYLYKLPLKDMLNTLTNNIFRELINSSGLNYFDLLFGSTKTQCNNSEYNAAFSFDTSILDPLTKSKISENITTIRLHERIVLSTLKFDFFDAELKDFLSYIGLDKTKEDVPEWLKNFEFLDDKKQIEVVESATKEIEALRLKINDANKKLEDNLTYKRALIDNDKPLVNIVFDMLEKMLCCDLSDFKDEKKEDFLIKLDNVTFVGEIKGITSNVRNENVSQASGHRDAYLDKLNDEGKSEEVRAILIINTFRKKDISSRDEVHEDQINKAKRYECLIITTYELLKLFEAFLNHKTTSSKIIEVFKTKTGLFSANDCLIIGEDNSAYMI